MTVSANETNSTWPFVTLNDFQRRSASARSLSGSYFTSVLPIITTDDIRRDWETYSMAQKGWLTEGRQYEADQGLGDIERTSANAVPTEPFIFPSIFEVDENFTVSPDKGVRITTHFSHEMKPYHIIELNSYIIPPIPHSPDRSIPFGRRRQYCLQL
jgi:hypothetical protein